MARGVKQTDEEKLEVIEKEIAELESRKAGIQAKINERKESKRELENTIKLNKLSSIQEVLDSTGMTPEDLLELIKSK